MGYKYSVKNQVTVSVKFSIRDGDKPQHHSFDLTCERVDEVEFQARIRNEEGTPTNDKIREQMLDITTGWSGQQFVLDDDGTPAAFCRAAFDFMLSAAGVLDLVVTAYVKECKAKAKN